MTPIKVLVMEATQYQALIGPTHTCSGHVWPLQNASKRKTIDQTGGGERKTYQEKGKQKEELTWETDDLTWTDNDESEPTSSWEWEEDKENKEKGKEEETTQTITTYHNTYTIPQQSTYCQSKLICVDCGKKLSLMGACYGDDEKYHTTTKFYCRPCLLEHFERPKRQEKWDNQPCLACGEILLDEGMWNDIPGRGGMCDMSCQYTILISDWYCDKCNLIYNLPPRIIYSIPEEEEPISSCASESESPINYDSNSDDDNDNNGSSSIQIGNDDENNSDSDSKPDVNYEQYIALPDLSKKQELKWYSNNGKSIMPECAHDTDAGFDLRYPGKDAIKLELHSRTCIDLKIALEIPVTTMVQLASRSSLAKRGINIRGGIIDAGYVGNIIAMLQNNSEKAYIIEPNKKIAQAIFLSLIRVA
ncbi:hypothetical protein G9A89_005151 [Geosiphon pyriformis]|nr:hypothetical protein G9A89_005151 [Geosiphon pyriformis]